MWYKFNLLCVDGGEFGFWGVTGQKAEMCMEGDGEKDAAVKVENHIPGGWSYKCLGETKDTFYLRHIYDRNIQLQTSEEC